MRSSPHVLQLRHHVGGRGDGSEVGIPAASRIVSPESWVRAGVWDAGWIARGGGPSMMSPVQYKADASRRPARGNTSR